MCFGLMAFLRRQDHSFQRNYLPVLRPRVLARYAMQALLSWVKLLPLSLPTLSRDLLAIRITLSILQGVQAAVLLLLTRLASAHWQLARRLLVQQSALPPFVA